MHLSPERSEFTVRVHDEGDENGLWAEVVELPGCFASGDTEAELREAVVEAIELTVGEAPLAVGLALAAGMTAGITAFFEGGEADG
jgi:predicted RNase H-like HicB family nuclease